MVNCLKMAVFLLLLPPIYSCWLLQESRNGNYVLPAQLFQRFAHFLIISLSQIFSNQLCHAFFLSLILLACPEWDCISIRNSPRDVSVDRWSHFISFSTCKVNVVHRKTSLTTIYSVMQTEILPHSCSSGKTRSNYILRTFLRSFLFFFRVDSEQLIKLRTQEHIWYFPLKVTNGPTCPGLSSRVST